jgi:hypothetical protein
MGTFHGLQKARLRAKLMPDSLPASTGTATMRAELRSGLRVIVDTVPQPGQRNFGGGPADFRHARPAALE